jgi:hypothetical protein
MSITEYNYLTRILEQIDDNRIYILFLEKGNLEKISSNTKYLPCILIDRNDENDLINNYMIIMLSDKKIIYGFFKIETILLEAEDIELYNKLVLRFNLIKIPKLIFVSFNQINSFKYKIEISKINKNFELDSNYKKITMSVNYQPTCAIKNIYSNLNNYLNDYINFQETANIEIIEIERERETDDTLNYINMCVPILWNSCEDIKRNIGTGIKKAIILNHLTNCDNCEIVDNNIKDLNMKKKIVLNILDKDDENNINIFNEIIESYGIARNFQYRNKLFENSNININLDDINIFMLNGTIQNNIYSQCYFAITK